MALPFVPRGLRAVALAAATAGLVFIAVSGALRPDRPIDLAALFLASILTSALTPRRPVASDRGTMAPSFVFVFAAVLVFGAAPATLVAAATAAAAGELARHDPGEAVGRTVVNVAIAIASAAAAGFVLQAGAGVIPGSAEALRAIPMAAAALTYAVVSIGGAQLSAGAFVKRPLGRASISIALHETPAYVVGASLAAFVAALTDARMWQVGAIAVVPLYLLGRAYSDYLAHTEHRHRRGEVLAAVDEAMTVVDANGTITLWEDAAERLLGCTRDQAVGRPLAAAVPAFRDATLSNAIADTVRERRGRVVNSVRVAAAPAARFARVKLLPVPGGVTLLWHDVTEATQSEQALKRAADRLTLAARGANDGLWDWDVRTGELFASARWRELVGVPGTDPVSAQDGWLARVHPDDAAALNEAIRALVVGEAEALQHEHRLRHENGTYRWFMCRGVAERSGRRATRIAGSLTDTTERVVARERLRSAGFFDPLTGLRNRADFVEALGRRLDEFKRRPLEGRFAVLYLDLDRFKVINDSLGHLVGDELLVAVSRRLESCLRQEDCLGRLGGDEFGIILNTVGDESQANAIAFRIEKSLGEPLSVGGREVFTSVSIGIAFGHGQYQGADEIIRDADTAMYHAKARGKARHELFDADMHARALDRLGLENDLRHAVEARAFEVHYQPIVLLGSGMCVGFESLVRWTRNGEAVPPSTFVPLAEELGLIEPLGSWVLREACRTFAEWRRRFPDAGLDYITVNASSRQLAQHFPLEVEQALREADLDPAHLRIEVTETALLDSAQQTVDVLAELRRFGVKIYLDDFGTGYSSLSHLHRLPVDALKIDRSFVRSLLIPDRPAIVESILALARTMRTSVVAEGIEEDVQASELVRLGCTHAQGYLFSRPLPTSAVEKLIVARRPLGRTVPRPIAI